MCIESSLQNSMRPTLGNLLSFHFRRNPLKRCHAARVTENGAFLRRSRERGGCAYRCDTCDLSARTVSPFSRAATRNAVGGTRNAVGGTERLESRGHQRAGLAVPSPHSWLAVVTALDSVTRLWNRQPALGDLVGCCPVQSAVSLVKMPHASARSSVAVAEYPGDRACPRPLQPHSAQAPRCLAMVTA